MKQRYVKTTQLSAAKFSLQILGKDLKKKLRLIGRAFPNIMNIV